MTRQQAIRIIHTGKSHLGWDNETYRGIMEDAIGKRSCLDCTLSELEQMVGVVRRAGFRRPRVVNSPKMKKAYALWMSLHDAGAVRHGGWKSMEMWMSRQGVPGGQNLDGAIESLKLWRKRVSERREGENDANC